MIKYRKFSFFDKYLKVINETNAFLQKYDYYIKIPSKYDVAHWLIAALKKNIFVDEEKIYYDLENKETSKVDSKKFKLSRIANKGGILVFPNNTRITLQYLHNPLKIFKDRDIKKIFKKHSNNILWCMGNRYRGVYKNKPRNTVFNSDSDTLEILGLNSGELINVAVKIAAQSKQPILLIKDLNNEQMIILGKNMGQTAENEELTYKDELTDFDVKKLKCELNDVYKLCLSSERDLWEMYDTYPKFEQFWLENGRWFGK